MSSVRIGVDIGGTFTDCAVVDADGGVWTGKALSTADGVSGVIAAVRNASAQAGRSIEDVLADAGVFVHGTTIGTNAVLERTGAVTGLLTTRGHEDTLLIGRLINKRAGLSERDVVHVSNLLRTTPMVPRRLIVGVNERIDRDGDVLVRLDEQQVRDSVRQLVEVHGIQALTISFLWSFLRPDHELRAKEIALDLFPDLFVTTSAEIAPVIGEYERTMSAVINSYIGGAMRSYLGALEERLAALGFRASLLVMEAGGGITPVAYAKTHPIVTLDSGPVGGVAGARYLAAIAEVSDVLCTDVGGTSFDVAVVTGGRPEVTDTPVIDKHTYQLTKVAVASVAAGGGSIAHVDSAGILHVGPDSAGSNPGPACYGHGGTRATVTDASLLLGYLSADRFWGGRLTLDVAAAHAAFEPLADALGCTVLEAAAAVARIANANMADLVRKHTIGYGRDPADFAMLVYGGAGGVHGAHFGDELGVRQLSFVRNAGVFSALGMTVSDITFSRSHSALHRSPLSADDVAHVEQLFRDLEAAIRAEFTGARLDLDGLTVQRLLRARFASQVNEIEMDVTVEDLASDTLMDRFVATYETTYGQGTAFPAAGMEIVTLRVVGRLPMPPLSLDAGPAAAAQTSSTEMDGEVSDAVKAQRPMYDLAAGRMVTGTVYDGAKLRPGHQILGPAVIERESDTVVIPPRCTVRIDAVQNAVLTYQARTEGS